MADKQITELPALNDVPNDAMIPASFGGTAYKIYAAKLGSGGGTSVSDDEMLEMMIACRLIVPVTDGTKIYTNKDGSILLF